MPGACLIGEAEAPATDSGRHRVDDHKALN